MRERVRMSPSQSGQQSETLATILLSCSCVGWRSYQQPTYSPYGATCHHPLFALNNRNLVHPMTLDSTSGYASKCLVVISKSIQKFLALTIIVLRIPLGCAQAVQPHQHARGRLSHREYRKLIRIFRNTLPAIQHRSCCYREGLYTLQSSGRPPYVHTLIVAIS